MTRIGSGIPATGVKRFRNRNTRIQAKQAEINRLKELMKEGLIDAEEAIRRINILEEQIKELEFGVPQGGESDVEIEPQQNLPAAIQAPNNENAGLSIGQDTNSPDSGNDSNENNHREYGKNDYYSSNANILKAIHGLV